MNHPSHEEWMEFLYDEMGPAAREAAEAHLHVCPACKEAVARWRNTMSALDADEVSAPTRRSRTWTQAVPWAAAAGIALGLGFVGGRLNGTSRAELENRLTQARQEIISESRAQQQADLQQAAAAGLTAGAAENRRMLSEVAKLIGDTRDEDHRLWISTLQQLEERRRAEYAGLRSDFLTLARHTGSGFRQTESQLNFLASYLPSSGTELPSTEESPTTTNEPK